MKRLNEEPKLNNQADSLESKEVFDAYVESILFRHKLINKGNHGIIGLIDLGDLDPSLYKFFTKEEKTSPDKVAVKMLKVYSDPGLAEKEAKLQQEAAEALKKANLEGVSIPEVYSYNRVEITDDKLKDILKDEGIETDQPVGVIFMDYVQGEDLATYLYKSVVRKDVQIGRDFLAIFNPGQKFSQENLEQVLATISFDDLEDFIRSSLDFSRPGGKHENEGLKVFEQKKVEKENFQKLIRTLHKNDFVLDHKILDKIKEATTVLHENLIYHRDLHERNVMLDFDDQGLVNNVYIIDFGGAEKFESKNDDFYSEYGEERVSDNYLLGAYNKLTKLESVQDREKFFEKIGYLLSKIKAVAWRSEKLETLNSEIKSVLDNSEEITDQILEIKDLINDFSEDQMSSSSYFEDNWDLRLSLWNDLIDNKQVLKKPVLDYLENLLAEEEKSKQKRIQIPVVNSIRRFIQYKK